MEEVNVKELAVRREQRIHERWKEQNTFQQSIQNREGNPSFVFYEGPPTANGLPHVGHALGRTIKDVVARYKTMTGHQVIRKAGWDTHGLPVELGVEKQLGISGKHEIEKYGVEAFIAKCKESVFTYEKQWRDFTEQIGYWVDMDSPYITLDNSYIESVWNILGTLHERGLLYKGHRVSPYCPSCQTSLSSHEVAQGYKNVKDLTATAKFKVKDRENEYFLGWTTTPWTLPANVALAVHPDMEYVRVKEGDCIYIVAKARTEHVLQQEYTVLSEHKGKELAGLSYVSPFDFVNVEKGHQVVTADYVTEQSGTGIVHIAPAYGEDDYKVIRENGFSFVNVVDGKGQYTSEVPVFQGRFVKDCDVDIIRYLADKGLLYHKEKHEHSYPHCWRCDAPLLYYANESWFIQTTAVKEQFIQNNEGVTWYPDHIKHGRFGNFLENMVDWNISRNRYWGTPLNVWQCQACDHQYAPKSIQELKEHATHLVPESIELHKPYVDEVKLCCTKCGAAMTRTPEVIDVWFDSGSMPFAQYHYPFANKTQFEKQFPADVVIEGIDQTRGWFYSLLAVSTLFTGKAPYKRVLSLGHILDENGQKMSKSKGNALDPVDLIQKFGADALRWALLADSAPWNPKRFSERVVQEAKSKVIDTFVNVYGFYVLYANLDGYQPNQEYKGKQTKLDEWILSRLHSTIKRVRQSLDDYQFTNAAREIATFVEELSNWYVRRSRDRFWSQGMSEEKAAAYATLHEVIVKTSQLLAPLTPFVAEDIYSNLEGGSVHLTDYPDYNETKINKKLEEEMNAVLQVVEVGRSIRNTASLKVKQPLASLSLLVPNHQDIQWNAYRTIIKEELNVKAFHVTQNDENFVSYKLKLDFKKAGPKFGNKTNQVHQWLQSVTNTEAKELVEKGNVQWRMSDDTSLLITAEDVQIEKVPNEGFAIASNGPYTVILDTTLTEELIQEGVARELLRAIQEYRKKLNLPVNLRIDLEMSMDEEMKQIVVRYESLLQENLLMNSLQVCDELATGEQLKVGSKLVTVRIVNHP
ncbi:isoleucyl-tRNA synthetase [Aneurinibacillus soli]|uniref:Isoleucine--tRNA ligase n=1 Tax=Aneurinibacillus soli TaxID=1500254 RepID=A0A0U5BK64_9BACL|nr:isoleucine--tRNA ligase [Aneurinibacillus soli]PYE62206.1 isoleucyl-tRNA synthetase [Aneurinibacillus soli]BAU28606.1 Isoleucine--tRNA ligase [Aneurinibacillus soli]